MLGEEVAVEVPIAAFAADYELEGDGLQALIGLPSGLEDGLDLL